MHAWTESWAVAPVLSLSPFAPDRSLKPACLAWFPLSAAFPPSLPQALGTQHTPQEACVEGFKWEHSLVISGTLGVTWLNPDSFFNSGEALPRTEVQVSF